MSWKQSDDKSKGRDRDQVIVVSHPIEVDFEFDMKMEFDIGFKNATVVDADIWFASQINREGTRRGANREEN
ncbi:hypothetical protein VQ056_23020 [Paenibacillus sp. JTLBN-2024]